MVTANLNPKSPYNSAVRIENIVNITQQFITSSRQLWTQLSRL